MNRILVIRHAPTDWNGRGLIQGRTDEPLNEAGRATARRWRLPPDWSTDQSGTTCLASPLRRAMETASLLGLEARPEPRLIETDWGAWEGKRLADLRLELGAAMAENEARGLDFRPPGGESPRDVQARLLPLLARLDAPSVLVTHKGVLRALYALASGWTMQEKPPEKLRDATAHLFCVQPGGGLSIERLNIPLEPPQ